jgi:hypothetical protein
MTGFFVRRVLGSPTGFPSKPIIGGAAFNAPESLSCRSEAAQARDGLGSLTSRLRALVPMPSRIFSIDEAGLSKKSRERVRTCFRPMGRFKLCGKLRHRDVRFLFDPTDQKTLVAAQLAPS